MLTVVKGLMTSFRILITQFRALITLLLTRGARLVGFGVEGRGLS